MRYVVGVLVAAVVGIHCSAPVDDSGTAASEPELAAPPPAAERRAPPAEEPQEDPGPAFSADHQRAVTKLVALVHAGVPPHVTSFVKEPTSGATYVTGTFEGTVSFGKTMIHSRGDMDVFLLKLDAGEQLRWVRSVGSAAVERAPRVTLDEGRVTVLGMTYGQMDCGTGPLQSWSSDMFFVCMFGGAEGETIGSGVFPTGSP